MVSVWCKCIIYAIFVQIYDIFLKVYVNAQVLNANAAPALCHKCILSNELFLILF